LQSSNPAASFAVIDQTGCATITVKKLVNGAGAWQFTQLFDIVHRQFTKVTFVLTIEVRRIIVTDTKARLRGVKVFVQH